MIYYLSKVVWVFLDPSNGLTLLIALGLLLCWTRFFKAGRFLAMVGVLGLALFGVSPLGTFILRPLENRFPAFVDDGKPVAGILILGGALQTEVSMARGQLSLNESGERLTALVRLRNRYPEARVIFTGGAGELTGGNVPEAEAVEKFIGELLADPKIRYERTSRNTYENAVFSHLIARPMPGERWLLVTSAWHMPRSVGLFRKAGWDVTPYPVDYRSTNGPDDFRLFASISTGLRRTDLAVKEWAGLLFARAIGHSDALWPG